MTPNTRPLGLVDREPRNLPIPIGDLRPIRRPPPGSRMRGWRRRGPALLTLLGVLLVVSAAMVTVTRPPLSAYLDEDTVHVAGVTLTHPASNGGLASGLLYQGAATLLLVDAPDRRVVASAVTYLDGAKVTGVCDLGPPTRTQVAESCVLAIGDQSVTCDDVLRFAAPGDWARRCSDGQTLTVSVPQGASVIPLPFPLGR